VHPTFSRLAIEARTVRRTDGSSGTEGRVDLWVPDRVRGLRPGDILLAEARVSIPRGFGNPGETDRRARSFLQGVYLRGSVRDPRHLVRLGVAEGYRFERRVEEVRSRVAAFFERETDPEVRGLLLAWFLGDRSWLSESLAESFRSSGLAHLLAISGLHVGLVGLFTYGVFKSVLKRSVWILLRFSVEKIALLGCLPVVLGYVVLAGSPITAMRAAAMFVLFVGSLLLDRVRSVWNSLAVAALLILIWDPGALFSVSFQLSFAAVAGLLAAGAPRKPLPPGASFKGRAVGGRLLSRLWAGVSRLSTATLSATLSATLATAPLMAFAFNRVAPMALVANLAVVPLVGWLVMPLGLTTVAAALVFPPAAALLLDLTGVGTRWVAAAAEFFGGIPFASLRLGRPSLLEMTFCYVALSCWFAPTRSPWRMRILWVCVALLVLSVAASVAQSRLDPHLAITFLSVGQGDSALVEFPGGKRMILDGGPARKGRQDAGRTLVAPYLGFRRFRHLDYLVASHGQADHFGGLAFLADDLEADELWIGPELGCEAEGYRELLSLCRSRRMRIRTLCRESGGFSVNGVRVEVLNPPCVENGEGLAFRDCVKQLNDRSLVLKLSLGDVSMLFTGDIEQEAEEALLKDAAGCKATLLKVPHHGSPSSSRRSFLEAVAPGAAVVSAGYRNPFGFPSRSVVRRYRDMGIALYRTDLDGAVRCRTDGRSLWVETFRDRPPVSPAGPCAPANGGPP
jgi:competence protein ComEC